MFFVVFNCCLPARILKRGSSYSPKKEWVAFALRKPRAVFTLRVLHLIKSTLKDSQLLRVAIDRGAA